MTSGASTLTMATLLVAIWLTPAAAWANRAEAGPPAVCFEQGQTDGPAAFLPEAPPPLEAKDCDEDSSTSLDVTRWKLPGGALRRETTAAQRPGGQIVGRGVAAQGVSRHSVQVLFCSWQI